VSHQEYVKEKEKSDKKTYWKSERAGIYLAVVQSLLCPSDTIMAAQA